MLGVALVACGPTASQPDDDTTIDGGGIDGWYDGDHDGYPAGVDCNDEDPNIHPGAVEICDDDVDNNCNQLTDTDLECLPPCERAAAEESYFGCQFHAVDLPQFNTSKIFGISVSNPSNVDTAHVTISTAGGVVATLAVGPKGLETYQDAGRSQNISAAGISNRAFFIDSDLPIAAYQFNSLDTIGAASTDASLLFAQHSLAKLYYSMDYTARTSDDSFIAVYATEPDTQVDINPAVAVTGSTSAVLQPYDVLLVFAQAQNSNLTGSQITASKPVGVFGGNRCTNVPYGMDYCDHVEQQIFPRQAIGDRYIVGKSHARVHCTTEDYIRVMADVDTTTVTFDPPVAGPWTLDAGEWMETTITESVEVSATKPIMVGQFLRSSGGTAGCDDEGDPAFILQVPVDQYRADYIFLTPPTYQTDYVDILAPLGAGVLLDAETVTLDPTPIGATNYSLTSLVLADGRHVIQANEPVGVMVYGYGGPGSSADTQNVSYGYPAGLNLNPINPVE